MKVYVLDVWQDLREKRMWPVAIILVVALVAIPAVLMKGTSETVKPPEVAAVDVSATPPTAAAVQVTADGTLDPSSLDSFSTRDPFKDPSSSSSEKEAAPASGTASVAGSDTDGDHTSVYDSTPSGSPDAPGGNSGSTTGKGNTDTPAKTPSVKQPKPNTTKPAPNTTTKPVTYVYEVDVLFGRTGFEKVKNGVERMDFLPDAKNPLVSFLGVTGDRKHAVFLLTGEAAGQAQQGEGTCKPTRKACTFIYLATDDGHNEHFFTTSDGTEYTLELRHIKRVKQSAKASSSALSDLDAR